MKRKRKCPKCESTEIIEDVRVVDYARAEKENVTLETYEKPEAIFFKGAHSTKVSAWVCSACGFVELYAQQPTDLNLKK